jgi:tripeptidyl-peptidase-2
MPCSSSDTLTASRVGCGGGGGGGAVGGGAENASVANFKLNESTFIASLMPKKEIRADCFIEAHPEYDGRGVVIAIFDSGFDPSAAGLHVTSDGKPKVLDVIDCTGSGDIDTSTVVKANEDGHIRGASGATLVVNSSWKNPTGEWRVGSKLVYQLFTDDLTSRVKKERRKSWDEKNQEEIAKAVNNLYDFDQKHSKVEDAKLKKTREDLQSKVDFLKKQADKYEDKGPVIDAVVWHDGEVWRVALDTQSLEEDPDSGKLADFSPLTNYRIERKYGVFSRLDACSFVANVYDEGKVLSIVTDSSPHGTHVAGIATAHHPEEHLLNGVAPGAQIISCKIGDSRLGSMETGTGLTRALIAALEHNCDLVNMSYGEPALLPDYGRFVDLVTEAVNKRRLIFVSSAGNSGPALTTVGAPGGTTSSIIGVGAYVSPAMAAGAHSVVEPPSEGLEYTWSSRGPTSDGDLGVCISAPGGAVAPVPTWTLQRRMLMNGTSMASPSACGAIALLLSAMKAEGIPVSPYSVRRALENTSTPVGDLPEDKLTTGQGLMQVDKAYEYLKQFQDYPCVFYQIKVNLSGKTIPTSRGIYLREGTACRQSTEWTIQVDPKFHEGASNLKELVPFEECLELHSTDEGVVRVPDYLLLTNNGRGFNVVVDPTNLGDGVHYFEVYGIDCKAPERGPLFRIPVTIIIPKTVANQPPVISFQQMSFISGHIERRYIEVPHGATWAEATMRTSGFDTTRRFYIDTLQVCPLRRPIKWESAPTFASPSAKSFVFPVVSGQTMELAIAQFWSSGLGSREPTIVDFEIEFHGVGVDKEELLLDGSEAPIKVEAEALLASEKLVPIAVLNKIRVPYQPIDAQLKTLSTGRDRLLSGKQILALTLTYKFKLEDSAEVKPYIPLLNNRIYDTKFESQFFMISDTNKRVYAMGDVYPESSKLPKGEYKLQLYLRHENVELLEKLKQLTVFIERNMGEIRLNLHSEPDGPFTGNGAFKSSVLMPGVKEAFYLGPPTKDKLPKNTPQGSMLVGEISYGKLSFDEKEGKNPKDNPVSYPISYVVPPNKPEEDKKAASAPTCSKSVSERLEQEVRDTKIKFLGNLKQETEEERSEWRKLCTCLKSEYPDYTPLLAKILEGLLSRSDAGDKISHHEEIIEAANEVVRSVDVDELARFLLDKTEPEDDEAEKLKKKMEVTRDQLADALYQKGLAMARIENLKGEKEGEGEEESSQKDKFEENFKELTKWVDVKSSKYGTLTVLREKRLSRLGTALKVLDDLIQNENETANKKLYELKLDLLEEIGWSHLVTYEKQWMQVRFPKSLPLF